MKFTLIYAEMIAKLKENCSEMLEEGVCTKTAPSLTGSKKVIS